MILPEWSSESIIIYSFLAAAALVAGPIVYFGQSLTGYSKFRTARGIPSRVGMFILYSAPIAALFVSARDYLPDADLVQWVVLASVFIHFAKRILESLFLHKYSGPASLPATLLIASFYSTAAYLIGWLNQTPIPFTDGWFASGVLLFLVGITGNFIHHKLLADLRKDSLDYFIPKGGLFEYIACPHYLFEIVGWLGIFLLSRHLATLLILLFIIAYLIARSLRTLEWYRAKFADFPKKRRAILPFIL